MKFVRKTLLNRIVFIILAIGLQLLVLVDVIIRFNDYFAFFYGASILVSIVAVLWIINNRDNPAYKIAWIIPILLLPIFGGVFYLFFGKNKLSKRMKQKMQFITDKTREALIPEPGIFEEMGARSENARNQSRYIQNYADYPPFKNTYTEYLPIGELKFASLKEELRKAENYIFLEYFIIEEGVMWNSILDILVKKASAGVDVRVIYDDAGCLFTLPYGYNN